MQDNTNVIKKIKRVMALVGAVLLALLYIATLVAAIMDDPNTMSYFKAAVTLTIFVPVLIYAYQLVYRVLKMYGNKTEKHREMEKE